MSAAGGAILCFGEVLLRLNAPGRELLLQTPRLEAHVGGAEANVAVSLARLGHRARMASVAPEGPLGDAAVGELRRHGVDVGAVRRAPGRMGLYFMTAGAVNRPSSIVYDRAESAFARADPAAFDWDALLADVRWLHLSGVTPAVGRNAAASAIAAAEAAQRRGLALSFDGNYRAQLWAAWGGDGRDVLRRILACATTAFVNERDIALVLGDQRDRAAAFEAAFQAFPRLQTIAATSRAQSSVDDQEIAAELATPAGSWRSRTHPLPNVVDRIGGGDAFAAGVLHGLLLGWDEQRTIDFAAAAGAIKHSIPGDFNLASADDIAAVVAAEGLDVRR